MIINITKNPKVSALLFHIQQETNKAFTTRKQLLEHAIALPQELNEPWDEYSTFASDLSKKFINQGGQVISRIQIELEEHSENLFILTKEHIKASLGEGRTNVYNPFAVSLILARYLSRLGHSVSDLNIEKEREPKELLIDQSYDELIDPYTLLKDLVGLIDYTRNPLNKEDRHSKASLVRINNILTSHKDRVGGNRQ